MSRYVGQRTTVRGNTRSMMDGNGAMLAITLEVSVASIIPFLPRGVFDDVATKAMGEAFDGVSRASRRRPARKSRARRYSAQDHSCRS